ncbi:hypothetical protein [Pseudomonas oryzihabitans]|uniref:hypothetical protein n=1 Tax=Pseudomonas oryzihabitans TaxID=47885 RepID=UPI002094E0C5|nr:hypothetical protein [Pseudomonas psychrotolerans]
MFGAAIQLQRLDLDRGTADALTGKDLAADLVGAVAQSAGAVDPLGDGADVLQRIEGVAGGQGFGGGLVEQPDR